MISLADKLASGLARLAPFGRPAADPLASGKAAARWIDDLPLGDPFRSQQAILDALRRFNENSTPATKDRLAVLMLLDERSRDLQDTLVRQYLRNPRMSSSWENRLWHAVYGLYWEVARGYYSAVVQLADAARTAPQPEVLPLVTLRAIRAIGQLLKWRATRYLPAGRRLWARLHKLYRAAERRGFHRQLQPAYANEAAGCTCEAAYLHILMLGLANSGTLYPRQLDLIDTWLGGWRDMLRLDKGTPPAEHAFAVDLSADHGGRRLRRTEAGKPFRFWTTSALLAELRGLHAALHNGRLPAELGLANAARPAEILELLEHLQRQWSSLDSREQRRAPRESIKRLVDVEHGLDAVIRQIKTADAQAGVSRGEPGLDPSVIDDLQVYGFVTERTLERSQLARQQPVPGTVCERWVMQDESDHGYGAIVDSGDKDWLRVGTLIGLRLHDDHVWKIGIVRRQARLGESACSLGIETFAAAPTLAVLHDTTPASYTVNGLDNGRAGQPHAGLWLAGPAGGSVIIDPACYIPGRVFEIRGAGEPAFIALGGPIERSEGWVRVATEPVAR